MKKQRGFGFRLTPQTATGHARIDASLVVGMVFVLLVSLLAFAFYAFVAGNVTLATHLITGVLSAIMGLLAGVGLARGR